MSLALNRLLFASLYKYGFSKLVPKLVTRVVFFEEKERNKKQTQTSGQSQQSSTVYIGERLHKQVNFAAYSMMMMLVCCLAVQEEQFTCALTSHFCVRFRIYVFLFYLLFEKEKRKTNGINLLLRCVRLIPG